MTARELKTTEDVLAWADSHPTDQTVTQENWDSYCETAEKIALALAVLEIVERESQVRSHIKSGPARYILAEAKGKVGR